MNSYKIPAPYSESGGKRYIKIEIQYLKFNVKTGKTERSGKMESVRIDGKFTGGIKMVKNLIITALDGQGGDR